MSIGSKNRENYSKNNDKGKNFFRKNLEEKGEENDTAIDKTSRKNGDKNKKIREEEGEQISDTERITSKKYEKGLIIDGEMVKINNCRLKIEMTIGQKEGKNHQNSIFFKKKIQSIIEIQAMSLEKNKEGKVRNDEDKLRIEIIKISKKKKNRKKKNRF